MLKAEIEFLKRRAKRFYENALYNFEKGYYDLAMFNIEQAIQLLVEAKLLDLTGYFEKTHSIRRLLRDLSKVYKEDEINEILEKYWLILKNLEYSYIASRYIPEEFRKDEIEEAIKLYKIIKKLIWNS